MIRTGVNGFLGTLAFSASLCLCGFALLGCATSARGPDTERARAHLEDGKSSAARGDHARAIDLYSRALRENPGFPEAYYHRGYSRIQLRRAPGAAGDVRAQEIAALEDYSAAIRLNAAMADAYFNRAMILSSRAAYKQALEDLLMTIRLRAEDPEPHLWLGRLYEEKFEAKDHLAFEHYEKYADLGGLDATAREKAKLWKANKKQIAAPPATKAASPEEDKQAQQLHEGFKKLLLDDKRAEAVKALEELLSKYGHTPYVRKQENSLKVALDALKPQK